MMEIEANGFSFEKDIMRTFMTMVLLAGLFHYSGQATAQKKADFGLRDNVELLRDVEFGIGGGRPLKLHIIRPKAPPKEAMPVLVWIHGGGWESGDKDSGVGRLAPFAARGYLCASIEYRLSKEAIFPAQIEDCKCAIRFLRAKAKNYHLDADRIGVWGHSAGGHLAALLGTSAAVKELEGKGGWSEYSSKVNAVCDFCGPSDFVKIVGTSEGVKGAVGRLFGGGVKDKKAQFVLGSPVTHVTRDAAPILIVHGDQDTLVPLDQATVLHEALKKAGARSTLYIAKGQGHGLGGGDVTEAAQKFFDHELKRSGK
jgi:acetyl esterase/lipase